MSSSSFQNFPFLLDSVLLQNPPIKILAEDTISNTVSSQSFHTETLHELPEDFLVDEGNTFGHSTKYVLRNKELLFTDKCSVIDSSSSVVDKQENGDQVPVTQDLIQTVKKRKYKEGSHLNPNPSKSKDAIGEKFRKRQRCNGSASEACDHMNYTTENQVQSKTTEEEQEAPSRYIHVRAKRGHATDRHSLAERVRRERISERMKHLQNLVPGCDKITGKAFMLDEIINYVQSLQSQVELLSMRLASVDPTVYDFGMDFEQLMAPPDLRLNGIIKSIPTNQCSLIEPTDYPNPTNFFSTSNSYRPFMDSSFLLPFQARQLFAALPQCTSFSGRPAAFI